MHKGIGVSAGLHSLLTGTHTHAHTALPPPMPASFIVIYHFEKFLLYGPRTCSQARLRHMTPKKAHNPPHKVSQVAASLVLQLCLVAGP